MVSSKKGDLKKSKAYKSIVNLVCRLPSDVAKTRLPASKLQSLLVDGGVVAAARLAEEHVRSALHYYVRGLFASFWQGEELLQFVVFW